MRKAIIVTAWSVTLAMATLGGYSYGHRDALPMCTSEDSPSCVWTDPDTGIRYVNGDDTGMSACQRYGLACPEGRTSE